MTRSAIMLSTHLGIQRDECSDTMRCIVALLRLSERSPKSSARSIAACAAPPAHSTAKSFEASGAAGTDSMPWRATLPRNSPSSGRASDFTIRGSSVPTYCASCFELSGSLTQRVTQPTTSTRKSCSCATLGLRKLLVMKRPNAAPILVVRHDSGMRDGDAERMPEQSHDREPVGASADHARFREGTYIRQPGPVHFDDAGRDENTGHHPQQGDGDHPHALEIGELGFRALDFGLGGSRNPWHRDWPPSPLGSGPGLQVLRKQTLVVVPYERLPIPTLEPTYGEMRLRDALEMIDENEVDRGSPDRAEDRYRARSETFGGDHAEA